MSKNRKTLTGKTVLVVDDEEFLREAISFDLKRRGCLVFEAANGTEALKIIETQAIDGVISDVRMPNGDGVTLLEKIRLRDPEFPPVLLVTGYADISESELIRKGAKALLEKPIDRSRMLDLVDDMLKI